MGPEAETSPKQPKQSAAFSQFREASGATSPEDQERVRTAQAQVDHLMQVSAEELVLLHQMGIASIDTEMARRSLEATNTNTAAVHELHASLTSLQEATARSSRRLTALTIAVGAFALVLLGLSFVLVGLAFVQVIVAIVLAHG